MAHTVFFSWQEDTATSCGRNFIEKALESAIKRLAYEVTVEESSRSGDLAVDRDTKDVPGTPPIVDTIFKKIDRASIFVADLTFVATRLDGRPSPNPNVLLEYGWALKSLGYHRIVVLMNTAFGMPTDSTLPFNMKHLRWPKVYHLPENADSQTRQEQLEKLTKVFKSELKAILESQEFIASLPVPPEPQKFVARTPADGESRFASRKDAIGVVDLPGMLGGGRELILSDGPAMWLRVMPEIAQQREWTIGELRTATTQNGRQLFPLGAFTSWGYIRSSDGYGLVPTVPEGHPIPAVALAFKSGEVWSVYSGPTLRAQQLTGSIEGLFVDCFKRCVSVLRDGLGVQAPFRWIAGIEGMYGKQLCRVPAPGSHYLEQHTGPCLSSTVSETGLLQATDEVHLALRPFFRKLYDACGAQRPDHMDTVLRQAFGN